MRKGTFNHCGKLKASLIEHHGRYVFQTAFFLRSMNTDMYICTYTYTYIYIHTYIHIHLIILVHIQKTRTYTCMCVCVCVFVFFVVWCRVMSCARCSLLVWCGVVWCGVVWCGVVWCGVVWCGVVWCGVVWCVLLSTCRCRGGPCPWSFQLRMMSFLQRARAERSMIERRVGQYMECVVLVPFSK